MKLFLSGNEAIAFGLIEAGVRFIVGYPGTPSSEVIPTAMEIKRKFGVEGYFDWSVNEKVAFEEATAASYARIGSAVVMKQVGLNVAMDPFMNTAMTGTPGGLVVVVADDPGPHSSQTEQDSRFLAFFGKIPVLEPSTPKEAYEFAKKAFTLSVNFEIPVMVRPTTRVSHSREDVEIGKIDNLQIEPNFVKDVDRFAATPHFRLILHKKLNDKIERIRNLGWFSNFEEYFEGNVLIVTSGVSFAYLYDIIKDNNLENKIKLLRIRMPYPLNLDRLKEAINRISYDKILVIEEGYPVIEMQLKTKVATVEGRLSGLVPNEGELTIDKIGEILKKAGIFNQEAKSFVAPPFKRPSLCPGCGHRSAFYAIKQVFKNSAIYTGDIGCYTLGLNLGAVDTVHCMGASVSFAFGFDKVYSLFGNNNQIVVATIGDSTFFHSGMPALIDAIHNNSKLIVVILDNSTVAMTGNQTTPANEYNQIGEKTKSIGIERVIEALGVEFLRVRDAYDIDGMVDDLNDAKNFVLNKESPAVLIFRHPCVYSGEGLKNNVRFKDVCVDENLCTGCKVCVKQFECPSLVFDENRKKVFIDVATCIKCGQCVKSCPFNAIKVEQ